MSTTFGLRSMSRFVYSDRVVVTGQDIFAALVGRPWKAFTLARPHILRNAGHRELGRLAQLCVWTVVWHCAECDIDQVDAIHSALVALPEHLKPFFLRKVPSYSQ